VFTQGYATRLRHRVALSFGGDKVSPSGIPAHVGVMVRIERLEHESVAAGKAETNFSCRVGAKSLRFWSNDADQIQVMLNGMLDRVCGEMRGIVAPLQRNVAPIRVHEAAQAVAMAGSRTWVVDGTVRRIPPNFKFNTSVTASTLFQLYCLGDASQQIGPYRKLESIDFGDVKQRKRLF
jgi:hypothetical protein